MCHHILSELLFGLLIEERKRLKETQNPSWYLPIQLDIHFMGSANPGLLLDDGCPC
jgi:hypothetical protein